MNKPVIFCVITVSAYFNGIQRQAILDAAKIAGLFDIRLFDKSTTAAVANNLKNRLYLVCNIGSSITDFSLLQITTDLQSRTYIV